MNRGKVISKSVSVPLIYTFPLMFKSIDSSELIYAETGKLNCNCSNMKLKFL